MGVGVHMAVQWAHFHPKMGCLKMIQGGLAYSPVAPPYMDILFCLPIPAWCPQNLLAQSLSRVGTMHVNEQPQVH